MRAGLERLCTGLQQDYERPALRRLKRQHRSSRRLRAAYRVVRMELAVLRECARAMRAALKAVANARGNMIKEL